MEENESRIFVLKIVLGTLAYALEESFQSFTILFCLSQL